MRLTCGVRLATVVTTLAAIGLAGPAAAGQPHRVERGRLGWTEVSAAQDDHTCGLKSDGSLWCWGDNSNGQLGLGDYHDRHQPRRVGTLDTWTSVGAGTGGVCGLQSDGTMWCWGDNSNGQLGQGTTGGGSSKPLRVGGDTDWSSVSSGLWFVCATKTDHTLWCWGRNFEGDLGMPGGNRTTPTQVGLDGDWSTVSTGRAFGCATKLDGTLWCWGYNPDGELGVGDTVNRYTPTQVGSATDWSGASAGYAEGCATKVDHTAWCWGLGSYGALGTGDTSDSLVPVQVGTAAHWASVETGGHHTCGRRLDDSLWCWGSNGDGELGTGDRQDRWSPTRVVGGADWSRFSADSGHTCSVRPDTTLWCWGSPESGQLGVGNRTSDTSVPVEVGLPNVEIPAHPRLAAVSMVSSDDAWAVGYARAGRRTTTLTEHWDGASWTEIPAPNPGGHHLNQLTAVDAVSTDDVWAVGLYNTHGDHYDQDKTLVLHWDGAAWTQVASPNGDDFYNNVLTAVSARSADDVWAVGYAFYDEELGPAALVLHWDGTAWTQFATSDDGEDDYLYAVAAVGRANVWAAGKFGLVEHYDGVSWGEVAANLGWARAMSAVSRTDIWTVGSSGAFHFDGHTWQPVTSPGIGALTGVSALTSGTAFAVAGPNAERWDGTSWAQVPTSGRGILQAVDAVGPDDAWAVGRQGGGALLEHWDGSEFTRYVGD